MNANMEKNKVIDREFEANTKDRQFQLMREPAVRNLERRDPLELARLSGAKYKANVPALELRFLGRELQISTTDWSMCYVDVEKQPTGVDAWAQLVILHYLAQADGFPVTWHEVTYGDFKDGLVRGTGFDRSSVKQLEAYLKGKSPEEVAGQFKRLGAVVMTEQEPGSQEPMTELTAVFGFLPHYPLTVKVWFVDEEFESTGKIFADKCGDHYLEIEDHVTAGQLLLDEICR